MADLDLVVAFLNTLDERTFRRHGENHVGAERLTSPRALSTWLSSAASPRGEAADDAAHDAGPRQEAADPAAHGAGRDGSSELDSADLAAAIELRTALRAVLDGDATAMAAYPVHLAAGPEDGRLRLTAATGRGWLDEIVEAVAAGVARDDWKRVKLCAAPDCRWAFHDTSRNGRGRWCDMDVCGNRHKTRAYRERRQQHGG